MINYWWVTRPKRKLTSVPEIVALFAETALGQVWAGQRSSHLEIEEALEREGLKRVGSRRDQTGGGARTYRAWIESLGLVFRQGGTGQLRLTLAGEAILQGTSPVEVLKAQIFKYQFPSSFSMSRGVEVHPRFRVRPFRFLLRLLAESRVGFLTEEEIGKIVAVEAENESPGCFETVVERLLEFRSSPDTTLLPDFLERFGPSKGLGSHDRPFGHLLDLANTMINWLEYTQLIVRSEGRVRLAPDRLSEICAILEESPPFIDRPENHEYFQRKFGLPPGKRKDQRDLLQSETVTSERIAEVKIRRHFLALAATRPVSRISTDVVEQIAETTGLHQGVVEASLLRLYPRGALGSFYSEFYRMAFSGRDSAREFEEATVEIMRSVFGYQAEHVGPLGKTPDIVVLSDTSGYCGIFDNKAYHAYALINDHRNRLIHNYIPQYRLYKERPLAFFSYIAGGFAPSMGDAVGSVALETGVRGSGVGVSQLIELAQRHEENPYSHERLRDLFASNKVLSLNDL